MTLSARAFDPGSEVVEFREQKLGFVQRRAAGSIVDLVLAAEESAEEFLLLKLSPTRFLPKKLV